MSQTTLEDDDLFGEAASEMRNDVEDSLSTAREHLPAAEDVWAVEADNALGVLNALRSSLDGEDAREHLRDAKKWHTMGERADAFEDGDDLATAIEEIEDLLADLADARDQVGDLASTLPQVRSALDGLDDAEASSDADETTSDAEADVEADADAEAEA